MRTVIGAVVVGLLVAAALPVRLGAQAPAATGDVFDEVAAGGVASREGPAVSLFEMASSTMRSVASRRAVHKSPECPAAGAWFGGAGAQPLWMQSRAL